MRLLITRFFGFLVIFIGISIVVNIIDFGYVFLGPLFLFGLGVLMYLHIHRWVGILFFGLSIIALFTNVFHINIGGVIFAALFIYIGFRLLSNNDLPFTKGGKQKKQQEHKDAEHDWLDQEIEAIQKEEPQPKQKPKETEPEYSSTRTTTLKTPVFRSSLIGDLHLLHHRFELGDMNISNGIGDIKIDLSKAIIPEGETTIAISGLIGDVDIYVPQDLEISTAAAVTIGDLEVLGHKQGGISRQIDLTTNGFKEADRRVKISVSLFIGDIDVRYL